ncbi:unnamed protein product [Orchesella dallaii]|uniref:Integral membrane protein DGCR2/IDD n=1 Tax=Orchesella dallaii TaxID=48710 RepID=A0ABP1RYI1_9HEXA
MPSVVTENANNHIFNGFGYPGGIFSEYFRDREEIRPQLGKHCIDVNQRLIPHGVHFAPRLDQCIVCACDDGEPKFCTPILCSPPQDCKSFKLGESCCDFICLDDDSPKPISEGPSLQRASLEVEDFLPKVGIGSAIVVLSMLLLLFLLYRRRQHRIHGVPVAQNLDSNNLVMDGGGLEIKNF